MSRRSWQFQIAVGCAALSMAPALRAAFPNQVEWINNSGSDVWIVAMPNASKECLLAYGRVLNGDVNAIRYLTADGTNKAAHDEGLYDRIVWKAGQKLYFMYYRDSKGAFARKVAITDDNGTNVQYFTLTGGNGQAVTIASAGKDAGTDPGSLPFAVEISKTGTGKETACLNIAAQTRARSGAQAAKPK